MKVVSSEFVVLCGLSGAGRSTAAAHLEDLGWFVMDNVPPALVPRVGELAAGGRGYERVALVVRVGGEDLLTSLDDLRRTGARVRIVFLDAATDAIVRRYEDTRRRHPGTAEGGSVVAAIEDERGALQSLKAAADVVVDTTSLNVHQLRARIGDLFHEGDGGAPVMGLNVVSFGYKHGLPIDVDLVFDCRFLPNPHWVDELRPLTGLDVPVRDYVLGQPDTQAFLHHLDDLLGLLLPAYEREGRTYLSVALGCTGGRHRSVAVAEAVADLLRAHGHDPTVTHRDVQR